MYRRIQSIVVMILCCTISMWNNHIYADQKNRTNHKTNSYKAKSHKDNSHKAKSHRANLVHSPIETSLVVDGKTGKVLHSRNSNKLIYPASLTKVATLYLLFEAIESGRITLDQLVEVSPYAASAQPGKLYLKAGEKIKVKDLILGMSVKSANDAARVAAEAIAGSEKRFARLMTVRARQLGMKNTTFMNASGLHHPEQRTTAIDLAKLTIAIKRDFPQYYHFFSKTSFVYKGKTISGHNRVTANYPGAEGLKTGFTNPSGCNLITTATRGNQSLIGIVTGSKTSKARDQMMISLLDTHFTKNKTISRVVAQENKKDQ